MYAHKHLTLILYDSLWAQLLTSTHSLPKLKHYGQTAFHKICLMFSNDTVYHHIDIDCNDNLMSAIGHFGS